MRAIGVNDSTTASQPSSIEISQDSGRSTRSKRNTSQRDTMDETGNTSSSRQPPQQHHERVSISGITVDGGSSMINTVENNISNNNGIGSNVSAITIMKSIRKRNTSQRDTTNGAANTSSSWPTQHQQQLHELVSISGITVDGSRSNSSITTIENNSYNNNGIGSNVTTSTKKKRMSSRKRKVARESLNNSLNSSILNETGDIDLDMSMSFSDGTNNIGATDINNSSSNHHLGDMGVDDVDDDFSNM